jgi:hypothetical protein
MILQQFTESCEEVSAFIGLLVIELHQYQHQFCINGDYMDEEVEHDLYDIIQELRYIQKVLQNPDLFDKQEKISELTQSSVIKFRKEELNAEKRLPTGYAYVIRSICKKKTKLFENDLEKGKVLFTNLEIFFTALGEYLSSTYFYRY